MTVPDIDSAGVVHVVVGRVARDVVEFDRLVQTQRVGIQGTVICETRTSLNKYIQAFLQLPNINIYKVRLIHILRSQYEV